MCACECGSRKGVGVIIKGEKHKTPVIQHFTGERKEEEEPR